MDCEQAGSMQVYGYYTDQGYWIYLRKRIIDNSLIAGVNFIAVISANPILVVSILNG
jgi:hypothetical protein